MHAKECHGISRNDIHFHLVSSALSLRILGRMQTRFASLFRFGLKFIQLKLDLAEWTFEMANASIVDAANASEAIDGVTYFGSRLELRAPFTCG